jgi:hypothetical protein
MKANACHVPGSIASRRSPLSRSAALARPGPIHAKSTYKTQTQHVQNRECQFRNHSAPATYNFDILKCLHSRAHPDPARNLTPNSDLVCPSSASECLPICPSADPPLRRVASLRLCVQFQAATKLSPLDKMRLFETETECHHRVFRTNRETFLRLVSFCPVLTGQRDIPPRRELEMNKTSTKLNTCGVGGVHFLPVLIIIAILLPSAFAKSSKSPNSPIFADSDHAVPVTYANQNRRAPIFRRSRLSTCAGSRPMNRNYPGPSASCPLSLGLWRRSLSPRTEPASDRVRDRLVLVRSRMNECATRRLSALERCHHPAPPLTVCASVPETATHE